MANNNKRSCFVLMPFTGEVEDIYRHVIVPTLHDLGYGVARADSFVSAGNIIQDILQAMLEADIIVAEVTGRNANVFYELAVAHTLGKPTIMLTRDYQDIPFDLKACRMIVYKSTIDSLDQLRHELSRAITVVQSQDSHSSPVRDFLPEVPSFDEVRALRRDFENAEEQLKRCFEDRKQLEKQIAEQAVPDVSPIDVIRELNDNEAVRKLQRELAQKERQIYDLAHKPETTDEQLRKIGSENQKLLNELQRMRSNMQVQPHWGMPPTSQDDNYIFVLMPYREEWSDIVWEVVRSTVTDEGFVCERADDKTGKFIMHDIWSGINAARIVIADLTEANANVTYEVGMCDVLGKDQILLAQNPKEVPFDFLGVRLVPYSYVHGGIGKLKDDLRARIKQIREA